MDRKPWVGISSKPSISVLRRCSKPQFGSGNWNWFEIPDLPSLQSPLYLYNTDNIQYTDKAEIGTQPLCWLDIKTTGQINLENGPLSHFLSKRHFDSKQQAASYPPCFDFFQFWIRLLRHFFQSTGMRGETAWVNPQPGWKWEDVINGLKSYLEAWHCGSGTYFQGSVHRLPRVL